MDVFLGQIERRKRLSKWFMDMGAVLPTDNLIMALEAMNHVGSTRALVTNSQGEVLGCVSVVDICRELLNQEAHLKTIQMQQLIKEERFK
jgi:CBS domain containing-hemolysin-like protein